MIKTNTKSAGSQQDDNFDIDFIVEAINKKINIPFLNEEQERVLIKAIILLIINSFKKN